MGGVAKPREAGKVAAAAVADGFEPPKAEGPEEPVALAAKAADPDFIDELRDVINRGRQEVRTWSMWNPLKYGAQALLSLAEGLLNQAEGILNAGGPIGQVLRDGISWVVARIRELIGI